MTTIFTTKNNNMNSVRKQKKTGRPPKPVDNKTLTKLNQLIRAVSVEWRVPEDLIRGKSKRSFLGTTDARAAICYLCKHDNHLNIPNFAIAARLGGVKHQQVSKYVNKTAREIKIYDNIREKEERAARNTPFLVVQLKIEFKEAA